MSAPPQGPLAAGGASPPFAPPNAAPIVGESCPLCAAPLQPDQEWCLNCGAAARTRLAASPNWKAPLTIAVVVVVLSLGVLAAALVKLAGGSGAEGPATTRTITTTTPGAVIIPTVTATTPTITTPTTSTATIPTQTQTTTVPGSSTP